jgi:hypothetical protein
MNRKTFIEFAKQVKAGDKEGLQETFASAVSEPLLLGMTMAEYQNKPAERKHALTERLKQSVLNGDCAKPFAFVELVSLLCLLEADKKYTEFVHERFVTMVAGIDVALLDFPDWFAAMFLDEGIAKVISEDIFKIADTKLVEVLQLEGIEVPTKPAEQEPVAPEEITSVWPANA